jgi:autotransporter-associated beta strand protein
MKERKFRFVIFFAAVWASTLVQADDATWNKTAAGNYDWTNVVNWLPATTFPNGAGQSAYLTNDIVGAPSIQLRQNITLGRLAAGDAVASVNNYGFIFNNKTGESFTLFFNSGADNVPALFAAVNSSGTPTIKLEAPAVLQSDLLASVDGIDANNRPTLAFNGPLDLNGRTITFTNGVAGQNQFSFEAGANLTGEGTLVNNAQTVVSVTGSKAFAGRLVANRGVGGSSTGSFTLTNGGFTNAEEFVINGFLTNGNMQAGASIRSGNNSGSGNNPGQRWTRKRVTLNGGSLDDGGQAANNNSGNPTNDWQRYLEYVRDDIATVHFKSGYSHVSVNASTTTAGTVLSASIVERNPGAAAYLFGPNTTNKQFLVGNASSLLIGDGGPSGSQTMSVIPWLAAYISGGFANPLGFATYQTPGGMRGLFDSEYTNSLTAGPQYNVTVTSLALASDATVNALRAASIATPNIGANRTLTVVSGGVFFKDGNRSIGTSGNAAAGTLNFGSAEGIVWVLGTTTNTIGAKITGSGGLTKTSTGTLTLTATNLYSGGTYVGSGTLRVGDGTYAATLGSGNVEVHAGATLQVSCANAIANEATLSVLYSGLYNGRIQLDTGVNETIRFLYLGGTPMPSGTYGSSVSAADKKNDQYFSGEGMLTVSGDATRLRLGTLISIQ